jgi:glycosyltransferase involved in cell wall biosynthesis
MPSLYEGFGLPVVEAMQTGCPVVTSKEGSLPEVGGDAVLYIDPYNIENMAKTIKSVFNDVSKQKELSSAGLARAKHFSWLKTAQETMKVYENTARKK